MKNINLAHYLAHINSSKMDTQKFKNCITPTQTKSKTKRIRINKLRFTYNMRESQMKTLKVR